LHQFLLKRSSGQFLTPFFTSNESGELSQFKLLIKEVLEQTNQINHTRLQEQCGNHPRVVKKFKHEIAEPKYCGT